MEAMETVKEPYRIMALVSWIPVVAGALLAQSSFFLLARVGGVLWVLGIVIQVAAVLRFMRDRA